MKKLFYLFTIFLAVLFAACEPKDPSHSNKVETGTYENITQSSVTLKGVINVDIATYNSVEFGVFISETLEDVNEESAIKINGDVLIGKEFKIQLNDLPANTKFYYCAYLLLNDIQYEFGAVKECATLSSYDDPSNAGSSSFVAKPFSISETKTITFSPGNLQFHVANNEWRFASSQLDYVGNDNENISDSYNGWIDLFAWGSGNNPTNISTDCNDYSTFVDWGVNKIGEYAPNIWRTLTKEEWNYMLNERINASSLKGVAQVNGVNGFILLPDDWICPMELEFKYGFDNNCCIECYRSYQIFNGLDWYKLESLGAIFLPSGGGRYGCEVYDVGFMGYYWSASESDSNGDNDTIFSSLCFCFCPSSIDAVNYGTSNCHSVRLVRDN